MSNDKIEQLKKDAKLLEQLIEKIDNDLDDVLTQDIKGRLNIEQLKYDISDLQYMITYSFFK